MFLCLPQVVPAVLHLFPFCLNLMKLEAFFSCFFKTYNTTTQLSIFWKPPRDVKEKPRGFTWKGKVKGASNRFVIWVFWSNANFIEALNWFKLPWKMSKGRILCCYSITFGYLQHLPWFDYPHYAFFNPRHVSVKGWQWNIVHGKIHRLLEQGKYFMIFGHSTVAPRFLAK